MRLMYFQVGAHMCPRKAAAVLVVVTTGPREERDTILHGYYLFVVGLDSLDLMGLRNSDHTFKVGMRQTCHREMAH